MNAPASVAVLTSPRPGAIAVIEVAGSDALALAATVARPRKAKRLEDIPTAVAVRVDFFDHGEHIDEGLLIVRERSVDRNVVELHTHGSPRVVQRLVAALVGAGATLDDSSPKDDLDGLLMRARTRRAVEFVLRQAHELDRCVDALRRCACEHGRDWLARELDALLASAGRVDRVLDGFTLAIIGPPGAGKTTLANRLIGEERLLTSERPGTTRDASHEPAAIDGIPFTVIDTAGDRATEDLIEAEAIRRGQSAASSADVRLVVLDRSGPLPPDASRFLTAPRPALLAANKTDLPAAWSLAEVTSDICAIEVSARRGDGLEALRAGLRELVGVSDDDLRRPTLLTAVQGEAVRAARAALNSTALSDWPSVRPCSRGDERVGG